MQKNEASEFQSLLTAFGGSADKSGQIKDKSGQRSDE